MRELSKASLERLSVSEDVSVDIRGKRLLVTRSVTDPVTDLVVCSWACN